MKKRGEMKKFVVMLVLILAIFFLAETLANNSGSNNQANLTIWTSGSINNQNLTIGIVYPKDVNYWNFNFYANFTNSSTGIINSTNGNCTITFNETGENRLSNMSYNTTSKLWQYNKSFNYKGNLNYWINCTNYLGNISLVDSFRVLNTRPSIIKYPSGFMDPLYCTEDTSCVYNITANITEDDYNDILLFQVMASNTTLTNYSLATNGILLVNKTLMNQSTTENLQFTVEDSDGTSDIALLPVSITAVNDAPVFNIQNRTMNASQIFNYQVQATDEENNFPYKITINFTNCSTQQWSTRNTTNCSLFSESQYSFNSTTGFFNLSFTPSRNDVGSYLINFTISDSGLLNPVNASSSKIVNFTVNYIKSPPIITYICDHERNQTENSPVICWINATDIDETLNLTFSANYSWFKFNATSVNSAVIPCNITTNYTSSALVNFTPSDLEVGNWQINISVSDSSFSANINSTIITFFINNSEDNVTLDSIANYTIYENKTIFVNATDDDLLVPDKTVKNEVLVFTSNTSWVSVSSYSSSANHTTAKIEINYLNAPSGISNIKINVTDSTGNFDEKVFSLNVQTDNSPVWNQSKDYTILANESDKIYLNLSNYAYDIDGDDLNFISHNDTSFPSFNLTGKIINFTTKNEDVGQHLLTINVSDGKLSASQIFNFTILNVNQIPVINSISSNTPNSTYTQTKVNTQEDNLTIIYLNVYDDDFKIPKGQKGFYNETLNINTTIQGINSSLLSFVLATSPTEGSNLSIYIATFTPRKSDIGDYNLTINVSDSSNSSSIYLLNLSIFSMNHNPALNNVSNYTSAINKTFSYLINATDIEDGNSGENTNFTFSIDFNEGLSFLNSTSFNSTSGLINITFNSSQKGKYELNLTVNDSTNRQTSSRFWIYVYDFPELISPPDSQQFYLAEGVESNLTFNANHSIKDNLTYEFYLNSLKYNLSYYGNGTSLLWQFTPNYSEETHGSQNLTIIIYNPIYKELNSSFYRQITINHTNAPINFSGRISDTQLSYGSQLTINLSEYFSDEDKLDVYYNQTINYTIQKNSTPSYTVSSFSGDVLTLSSVIATSEIISITGSDMSNTSNPITNTTSNTFKVEFTAPVTVSVPSPSSGGGGSATPVALKIILPGPISALGKSKIQIPISLKNSGNMDLYGISLSGSVLKNNKPESKISLTFSSTRFETLSSGEEKKLTITADINTDTLGAYELTINANSERPKYADWGKIYLTIKEANQSQVNSKIIFIEELIAENPECIEISEIVKEAERYYNLGDYSKSIQLADDAIQGCKSSISGKAILTENAELKSPLYQYLSLTTLAIIAIGLSYYFYRRARLRKRINHKV